MIRYINSGLDLISVFKLRRMLIFRIVDHCSCFCRSRCIIKFRCNLSVQTVISRVTIFRYLCGFCTKRKHGNTYTHCQKRRQYSCSLFHSPFIISSYSGIACHSMKVKLIFNLQYTYITCQHIACLFLAFYRK